MALVTIISHNTRLVLALVAVGAVVSVIVVALILWGTVSPSFPPRESERRELEVMLQVAACTEASFEYKARYGRLPSSASELSDALNLLEGSPKPNGWWSDSTRRTLVDPWKTPLSMHLFPDSFAVISAGPDKKFGTGDDISNSRSLKEM